MDGKDRCFAVLGTLLDDKNGVTVMKRILYLGSFALYNILSVRP